MTDRLPIEYRKNWLLKSILFFWKNGPNATSSLFIFVLFLNHILVQIWLIDKGVLGTRTQGSRMEGADESIVLCRHPQCSIFNDSVIQMCMRLYAICASLMRMHFYAICASDKPEKAIPQNWIFQRRQLGKWNCRCCWWWDPNKLLHLKVWFTWVALSLSLPLSLSLSHSFSLTLFLSLTLYCTHLQLLHRSHE